MMKVWIPCLLLLLGIPSLKADRDITVVSDLSLQGRKFPITDKNHPQYYQPLIGGFHFYGDPIPGLKPIPTIAVVKAVARELAKENYLVMSIEHPKADILLDITWGVITPDSDTDSVKNQIERFNLVLGHTITSVMPPESFNRSQYLDAAFDERYFIVLTAYDADKYTKTKKRVALWQTKMSIPLSGIEFTDIIDRLVASGAPYFGKETASHPALTPITPQGKVEVGNPTVKP